MVFSCFSKLSCLSPAAARWGWGKSCTCLFSTCKLCCLCKALLDLGCHPEQKSGKSCAAATLLDSHSCLRRWYCKNYHFVPIPFSSNRNTLKGVLHILKETVLIACKAMTSLTWNWNLYLIHFQLATNLFLPLLCYNQHSSDHVKAMIQSLESPSDNLFLIANNTTVRERKSLKSLCWTTEFWQGSVLEHYKPPCSIFNTWSLKHQPENV